MGKYSGSNREWLNHMSMYDLLCVIQKNLNSHDYSDCILDLCSSSEMSCKSKNCMECIAEWLNQPHEG